MSFTRSIKKRLSLTTPLLLLLQTLKEEEEEEEEEERRRMEGRTNVSRTLGDSREARARVCIFSLCYH